MGVGHGFRLALVFSAHLNFTSWICCTCSPRGDVPNQPVMCCEAWGRVIYCEAAWIPSGTFGTSSPSTILSVIIMGLMGGVCFLPALRFAAQGERLLLLSLGYATSTSQNTGTNPFQGLASTPDTLSVGYRAFIPHICFEIPRRHPII